MKSAVILGLYSPKFDQDTFNLWVKSGAHIYTVNDWFSNYPNITPNAVFNLHSKTLVDALAEKKSRFGKYWKSWYKDESLEIVISEKWQDSWKSFNNTTLYPIEESLQVFPNHLYTTTPVYMMGLAYLRGCREMLLTAMDMRNAVEREVELVAIVKAIDILRQKGVNITCEMYSTWVQYLKQHGLDESKLLNIKERYDERYE